MTTAHATPRLSVLLALLSACLTAPALAVPAPEAAAALKDKLQKQVEVQFLESPLRRVIEHLQRQSGITMVIDRESLGAADQAVSLEAAKISVETALTLVTRSAGADWDITDGVILVGSRQAILRRQLVVRNYDIRPILVLMPNFMSPTLDVDTSLSNTNSGSSGGRMGEVGGIEASLFGDDRDFESGPSRAERLETLVTLIMDSVGRQEDWQQYGGDLFTIREVNGVLIVRAGPQEHRAIEALLDNFEQTAGRIVNVEARFLAVPGDLLDQVARDNGGRFVIAPDRLQAVLEQLGDAGTSIGRTRTVCHNGQRIYLAAGSETVFLSDLEPIPDAAGADPTLSTARSGAVLDVEPTTSRDGKAITLVFRSEVVTGMHLRTTAIPVGHPGRGVGVDLSGDVTGVVSPQSPPKDDEAVNADLNGRTSARGQLLAPIPPRIGVAHLEMPQQDIVRYRSAIRIPNGGAVILTGASSLIQSLPEPGMEVVLVLSARSEN